MPDKYDLSDLGATAVDTTAAAPASPVGETVPPAPPTGPGIPPWLLPAAGTAAAVGAGGLALSRIPAVTRQLSREPGALGAMARGTRAAFGRVPRAPEAARIARPAAAPPDVIAPRPASHPLELLKPKLAPSLVEITPEDIAQHKEFARFRPGQTMSRKNYEDILLGRAKDVLKGRGGKRAAKAPGRAPPSAAPEPTRGAPLKFIQPVGEESALEQQMRATLENAPAWRGASQAEREAARAGLESAGMVPRPGPLKFGRIVGGATKMLPGLLQFLQPPTMEQSAPQLLELKYNELLQRGIPEDVAQEMVYGGTPA